MGEGLEIIFTKLECVMLLTQICGACSLCGEMTGIFHLISESDLKVSLI